MLSYSNLLIQPGNLTLFKLCDTNKGNTERACFAME